MILLDDSLAMIHNGGSFTKDPTKLVTLGSPVTSKTILVFIGIPGEKMDNLSNVMPVTSRSGRTFLRNQTDETEASRRFFLVPAEAKIAAGCSSVAAFLTTDLDEFVILDTRKITSKYVVLFLQSEEKEIAISVIDLETSTILVHNSYECYDRWLTEMRQKYIEDKENAPNVGETDTSVPAPVYERGKGDYTFAEDAFVSMKNLPTSELEVSSDSPSASAESSETPK